MDTEERERQQQVREVSAAIMGEGKVDPNSLNVEPLAGMTNRNYLVGVNGTRYVVRIPGLSTEEYVDRKADEQAARMTSDAGISVHLVHYDNGIQITEYVENSVPLDADILKDPKAIERAAVAFHQLHNCGHEFLNRFDEKIVAQEYLDVLKGKNADLPEGYDRVQKEADVIREALAANRGKLSPCHNDPAPENIVDTGERAYILDWEFGGNNDPYWDLADFSVEADFTEEQDRIMLNAYLGREPNDADYGRIVLQKSLAFLLWTLWGVLQEVNQNPRPAYHFASYWDYAMDRFTRCQEIMNADSFGRLMDAVKGR